MTPMNWTEDLSGRELSGMHLTEEAGLDLLLSKAESSGPTKQDGK